jgi:beta-1,4-mannosyltransferase
MARQLIDVFLLRDLAGVMIAALGMTSQLNVFMLPTFHSFNKYCSALIQSVRREGVNVQFISEWTSTLPIFRMLRTAGLPHVIHLHWIETYTIKKTWCRSFIASTIFICELALLKILGVRIVWTIHDTLNVDGQYPGLDIKLRRLTAKLATAVIVHTKLAREEVTVVYQLSERDEQKIHVVPHGHYIEAYPNSVSRHDARESLGLEGDLFVFGFVGYLRPYKGVLDLIQAFRRLGGENIRLVIAGMPFDVAFAHDIQEATRGDDRIQLYLKFIEDEKLQIFLNAVDVVVLPYRSSLTSGSLLLAMSFGKAVVVADHASIREILSADGALTYSHSDLQGLARCLSEIQRRDVASMGERNLERAETFEWDSIAKSTTRTYYEVTRRSVL